MAYAVDITSPDDPRVDDFRDLSTADRRPDRPGGKGLVIGEGTVVVERMLGTPFEPYALLGVARRYDQLCGQLRGLEVPFYRASADTMATIVGFHLNRGVLAVAGRPAPRSPRDLLAAARTIAVLEGVNDHENLGSIFRNAAALGVDAVFLSGRCADPLYRRSVRVSMGHVLRVPFAVAASWPDLLGELQRRGFSTVALTPAQPSLPLAHAVASEKVAFVLGAEGPGLSEETLESTDVRAHIPMTTGVDSLNVATAAAVAFYERARLSEDASR
ncbi:TrmH family RNA methyltransferase [Hoyosella subflava]|uniref:Putative ribosomal RNA methyltransferase n=1 Tax=Hoyosella subflava (strain DSM 45089 / JCM 17490 / NBRC 109087 / DQS3-9A1) TaxID=443218 RepID=F6EM94_HOYSD|nr:RNA methyltransferase [Hoyosella subflava]AEF39300.1 Putative ribosomal RNA methyltransferase [Hoyosella subflava DQS3-9A1]